MRARFRPHPLLTLAAALLMAATLRLAWWQFERAAVKREWETQARAAAVADAVTVRAAAADAARFQRAAVVGAYVPAGEILLDNRIRRRRVGYDVVTPFALADGGALMIKRGWLPAGKSRAAPPAPPPAPAGRVTVRGVFYSDESDAFVLSDAAETGIVRQRLRLADYAAALPQPLMSVVLIKEADGADGDALEAAPLQTDFKSARSTIYAWQWLTFFALTVVFYILLGRRR